ncbi:hypothetical protein OJ998_14920 [Solirubrobacter taibaiensis]|nr:hypothetical protein [Solirubrobacter taibaiensis]
MDYELSRLSTRSFEQLVQALSVHVLGPNVVVFGDGRDGGREATHEGPLRYGQREWDGYLVVQAKFRQRHDGRKPDGQWALEALNAEMDPYLTGRRRTPDFYIFATNAVLSPVSDRGFSDRLRTRVDEIAGELGMRDYDIWDYDKIRTLLDGAADIRTAYAAWITPGDVLDAIVTQFSPTRVDFKDVIASFLQKELLADQYVKLEQAGRAADEAIPLGRVFIDLPASADRQAEPLRVEDESRAGFVARVLRAGGQRLAAGEAFDVKGSSKRPRLGRYVLIGGPGQGKTTLGQYVCQAYRTEILGSSDAPVSPEVRQAMAVLATQSLASDLPAPGVRRFPVRVVLSKFAEDLAAGRTATLLGYVASQMSRRSGRDVSAVELIDWLSRYPWLLVLDGLDEVPASANRGEVLAAIEDLWVDLAAADADILVVATSRPQGYNDAFSDRYYQHFYLSPLSDSRALMYGERLAEARHAGNADKRETTVARLRRAVRHSATARLMRSPLQVTIMATLVDRMGQPPEDRWSLFDEYYRVIYQREVERDIPAADVLRAYKKHIDNIHARVGLLLQVASETGEAADAKMSLDDLARIVGQRLSEEGFGATEAEQVRDQIIEAAGERLVFLVGLEEGEVGFEIRSLQEFMASEGIMDGRDDLIPGRLRAIAPVPSWRNVFLFAAGKCFAVREYLRDSIFAICAELNTIADDALVRAGRAGSSLALDLLDDGPARRQPRYAEAFAQLALGLVDEPVPDMHRRLATVFEPRLRTTYQDFLSPRVGGNSTGSPTGAWAVVLALAARGETIAEELIGQWWPDTERARTELIEPHIYAPVDVPISGVVPQLIDHVWTANTPAPWELTALLERLARIMDLPVWAQAIRAARTHPVRRNIENAVPRLSIPIGEIMAPSIVSLTESDSWTKLNDINAVPGHAWDLHKAVIVFGQNPTAGSLASALRLAGKQAAAYGVHAVSGIAMPWPLAACVGSARAAEEVLARAELAAGGTYGDIEHWREAEVRWRQRGVSREDLEWVSQTGRWPFDATVAQRGFPIAASESSPALASVEDLVEAYCQLFSGATDPEARRFFAHNATGIVPSVIAASEGDYKMPATIMEKLLESLDSSDMYYVDYGLLAAIDFASEGADRLRVVIGLLSQWPAYGSTAGGGRVLDELIGLAVAYPEDPHLHKVLVSSLAGNRHLERPGLWMVHPGAGQWGELLRLLNEDPLGPWVDRLASDPETCQFALRLILRAGVSQRYSESVAVRVNRQMKDPDSHCRSQVSSSTQELLARRRSQLEESEWARLEFFPRT